MTFLAQRGILGNLLEVHNLIPRYYIEFNGTNAYINCGSDASLDNLPYGAFTFDTWMRPHAIAAATLQSLISKHTGNEARGWQFGIYAAIINTPFLNLEISGNANGVIYTNETLTMNTWYHLTLALAVDGWPYGAIGGTWCTYSDQEQLDTYYDDAANSMRFSYQEVSRPSWFHGDMAWARFSNGLRWTPGVNFTPPARCVPPVVDGTTVELWTMDEGIGVTTAASINTPANDGAMTNCIWQLCT